MADIDLTGIASFLFNPRGNMSSPVDLAGKATIVLTPSSGTPNQTHSLTGNATINFKFGEGNATAAEFRRFVQRPELDDLVTLYILDASILGGSVSYFTNSVDGNQAIRFGGNIYVPVEFESEGWEWNGQGKAPTPKIRIGNVNEYITATIYQYEDLLGATVTRIRTFRRYLDDGPEANTQATFPTDIYRVERKSAENEVFVEFELSSAIDQAGRMLPGRQYMRDICGHRYRHWDENTGDFSYKFVTCPYVGTAFFDEFGEITDAVHDKCGKHISDCKARFGNQVLPYRGFPGVARVRTG